MFDFIMASENSNSKSFSISSKLHMNQSLFTSMYWMRVMNRLMNREISLCAKWQPIQWGISVNFIFVPPKSFWDLCAGTLKKQWKRLKLFILSINLFVYFFNGYPVPGVFFSSPIWTRVSVPEPCRSDFRQKSWLHFYQLHQQRTLAAKFK